MNNVIIQTVVQGHVYSQHRYSSNGNSSSSSGDVNNYDCVLQQTIYIRVTRAWLVDIAKFDMKIKMGRAE